MSKLHEQPAVVELAQNLGLDHRKNSVSEIVGFCTRKVEAWLSEARGVTTLSALEELICDRLQLVFEEICSDDDLDRVIKKYVAMKEFVFATLRDDLDETTFATTLERKNITRQSRDRYVAVIDCRGAKASRRFFTQWHEIAHLLTLVKQLQLPFHRSTLDKPPLERMMDVIAGEVGFYGPMFRPVVMAETCGQELSLDAVERIRSIVCPHASFESTLIACVGRFPQPLVYVEAGMGYKKDQMRELVSNQLDLFPIDKPKPELRARSAMGNEAARQTGFRIDKNMQIPETSTIARCFNAGEGQSDSGIENLRDWRHSDGRALGDLDIQCQARCSLDRVLAVLRPLTEIPLRQRAADPEPTSSVFEGL